MDACTLLVDFVEVVHVELAHIGTEIVMFEEVGQHFCAKFELVFNDEGVSRLAPVHQLVVVLSLAIRAFITLTIS